MRLITAHLCAIVLFSCCYWVSSQEVNNPTTEAPKAPVTTGPVHHTTESHNTTSTTTTTTTTTTSTPTSTTTSTPITTPVPQPTVPTFEVKDKNGSVCIAIQALTSIKFSYKDTANNTKSAEFDLKNEEIKPLGDCQSNNTFISLEWQPKKMATPWFWHLSLTFSKFSDGVLDGEANSYGVTSIALNYTMDDALFPGAATKGTFIVSKNGTIFKAHLGKYYSCIADESIELANGEDQKVLLHTKETKIQAYATTSHDSPFLTEAESCAQDSKTSNLVPILVGVGLAIMILIALVVFLIGSRRRAATYESL